jgi:hypothetical protein
VLTNITKKEGLAQLETAFPQTKKFTEPPSRRRTPDISPQTSYRLDNRNYTGGAKQSDEQQVTMRRRKTTTKRGQRREHDQLPHPWVHLQDTFHLPTARYDGPGLDLAERSRGLARCPPSSETTG